MNVKMPDLAVLPQIFSKYPEVQAVYLFGSVATGKTHPESDLDLGIVPKDPSAHDRLLDMLADLTKVGFDRIDIVFLDTTDIVMKFEAVRPNRVVFQTPDFDAGSMYSLVMRQYFDYVYYLDIQRKAFKDRILKGKD